MITKHRIVHNILSITYNITTLIIILLLILTVISSIALSIYARKESKTNTELNSQLREMQSMKDRFIKLKEMIDLRERKIRHTKGEGVISILEQTISSIGLKPDEIRQINKNNIDGYSLEDVEFEIRGINLNEIVNLLYKIENSPFPLRIKGMFIKTAFDNPDRFTLKLTVSLISEG